MESGWSPAIRWAGSREVRQMSEIEMIAKNINRELWRLTKRASREKS